MTRLTRTLLCGASSLVLALTLSSLPPSAHAAAKPNLTGSWRLNHDKSDDARQKLEEARASSTEQRGEEGGHGGWGDHRGGGGWSETYPGGGGPGGGGTWGGRRRGGEQSGEAGSQQRPMQDVFAAPETLVISYIEPELSLTEDSGRVETFYTDGRKVKEEEPWGGTATVKAQWKDQQVVVERDMNRGRKLLETFALAPDGKELYVTLRVENPHFNEPVTIRRVYEHEQAEQQ